jgi:glycerol kinase
MEADSGLKLSSLKVDGGASANNYLVQTQADIGGAPVLRPRCVETTALGAAYLAGLAVGYWKDLDEVRTNWEVDRKFTPAITDEERAVKVSGWKRAVSRTTGWARE